MTISQDGNVGIGTTSPSRQLHVAGSTFGAMLISGVASDAFSEYDDGTNVWKAGIDYSQSAYRITHTNFNGSGISLDSSGNLTVDGNITTTNNIGVNLIELGGDAEHRLYKATTSLIKGTTTDTTVLTGRTLDLYAYDDVNIRAGGGDNISFTAGGVSNAMYINSSGNVGIGTTAPGAKLDVISNGLISRFKSTNSGTGGFAEVYYENDAGDRLITGSIGSGYTNTAWAGARYMYATAGDLMIKTLGSGTNLRFYTAGATNERMRIDGSGNVGIGTTSPENILHIQSPETTSTSNAYINIFGGHQAAGGSDNDGEAGLIFRHYAGSSTYYRAGAIISAREQNYSVTSLADSYLRFETAENNINSERMRINLWWQRWYWYG